MKKERNPQPPAASGQAESIEASMSVVKKAFTEWDRRYREEPDRFMSEAEHLLKETPETYGDACAPYFAQIISDIKTGKIA